MNTTTPQVSRIPLPLEQGRLFESVIDSLLIAYRIHSEGKSELAPAQRHACGFPLPPFQRDHKWTVAQEIAFIESAYLGLPIGTYTLHAADWTPDDAANPLPFSGWLIDGQQRLTAIQRYLDDQFPVFGLHWSELNRREQRRFLNIKFAHYEIPLWDEAKIRDLYNRLAFGGTAHTEDERA